MTVKSRDTSMIYMNHNLEGAATDCSAVFNHGCAGRRHALVVISRHKNLFADNANPTTLVDFKRLGEIVGWKAALGTSSTY